MKVFVPTTFVLVISSGNVTKSKTDVEHELRFHIVETNQPGLLGLTSSQDLGLIKVVMVAKTEEKQNKPDTGEEVTKLSGELKEDVLQIHAGIHWVGTFGEILPQ